MKKIKAFWDKLNKNLVWGVLCLVAATLLFFVPGVILHTLIKIAGAIVMAVAIIRFVYVLKLGEGGPVATVSALNAALLLAVGLIMLIMPGGTLRIIFSALGIYLLVNAILEIVRLTMHSNRTHDAVWWIDVIFTVAVFVLGLWLLLSPAEAGRVTEIVAGVSLTVKGVELLISAHNGSSGGKKSRTSDIETDFIDKSHEL